MKITPKEHESINDRNFEFPDIKSEKLDIDNKIPIPKNPINIKYCEYMLNKIKEIIKLRLSYEKFSGFYEYKINGIEVRENKDKIKGEHRDSQIQENIMKYILSISSENINLKIKQYNEDNGYLEATFEIKEISSNFHEAYYLCTTKQYDPLLASSVYDILNLNREYIDLISMLLFISRWVIKTYQILTHKSDEKPIEILFTSDFGNICNQINLLSLYVALIPTTQITWNKKQEKNIHQLTLTLQSRTYKLTNITNFIYKLYLVIYNANHIVSKIIESQKTRLNEAYEQMEKDKISEIQKLKKIFDKNLLELEEDKLEKLYEDKKSKKKSQIIEEGETYKNINN